MMETHYSEEILLAAEAPTQKQETLKWLCGSCNNNHIKKRQASAPVPTNPLAAIQS